MLQARSHMSDINPLFTEKPFAYKKLKDKTAEIRLRGKPVAVLSGKEFNKLERVLAMDNVFELQLFLSKITGMK
jgi:hypothetical protein